MVEVRREVAFDEAKVGGFLIDGLIDWRWIYRWCKVEQPAGRSRVLARGICLTVRTTLELDDSCCVLVSVFIHRIDQVSHGSQSGGLHVILKLG